MIVHRKIKTAVELVEILERRQRTGERIVFTNGCFDLLHVGHTRYLQAARGMGDVLVVGVNTDTSVRGLGKGTGRPIVPEAQRAEVLAAIDCVDFVVLFDEPDPLHLVTMLQPDLLVKGGDWTAEHIIGREVIEARGGTVRTIPLVPGVSTTELVTRIQGLQVDGTSCED